MRLCKTEFVVEWGIAVDINFLKAYAERCRSLAENADEFTKRRLLNLAASYDKRVKAAGPSRLACLSKERPFMDADQSQRLSRCEDRKDTRPDATIDAPCASR